MIFTAMGNYRHPGGRVSKLRGSSGYRQYFNLLAREIHLFIHTLTAVIYTTTHVLYCTKEPGTL